MNKGGNQQQFNTQPTYDASTGIKPRPHWWAGH